MCLWLDNLYLLWHGEVKVKEGHDPDVGDQKLDVVGPEVDELEHGQRHEQQVVPPKVESTVQVPLTLLKKQHQNWVGAA